MAKLSVAKSPGTNIVSIQERMRAEVASLAERTAPPSGDTISITQDKHFKLPNGTKHAGPMQLIIVDFISENRFYEGTYNPKSIVPPACFALGVVPTTMAPSKNAPNKQSDKCTGCPMNEYGSAETGKGKACKNTRVLAVLPIDADAETPLAILRVSPTGLKSFDGYVNAVAAKFNLPPIGVITEVSFDPGSEHASLRFSNPKPADDALLSIAFSRKDEARKRLEVEPDVSQYVASKPKKATSGRR